MQQPARGVQLIQKLLRLSTHLFIVRSTCALSQPSAPPSAMSSGGAAASASSTKAAYRNVVKGKLSLKGGTPKPAGAAAGGAKKPVKRKPDTEETPEQIREREERELERLLANKQAAEAKAASAAAAADDSAAASSAPLSEDSKAAAAKQAQIAELELDASLTKTERDFERAQKQRELDLIHKKIAKTHRQRVEEFNAYLSNLTEHNDIPRVGPG